MIFFKLPFSTVFFTVNENSADNAVTFFPFDKGQPVCFKGAIEEISRHEILNFHFQNSDEIPPLNFEEEGEYVRKIEQVIDFVTAQDLPKLVVSRRKFVGFESLDVRRTFLNLCENYPNAFVYLFQKDGLSWIGAFSELLGKFNKSTEIFETMSLAGTLPLNEDWSSKEIKEQETVSDYIEAVLKRFGTEVRKSPRQDHPSGNIKHLRTDFSAKISKTDVEKLVEALHPTPAVCGVPKDLCMEAIAKFETAPRHLYAGYTRIETEDFLYYFVNLRCAQLYKSGAVLYVGGGITAESDPQNEWAETELKSQALLKNMVFN